MKRPHTIGRSLMIAGLLPLILICSGCSHFSSVAAWEKGYLAKAEMRFDQDKLAMKNADHIYTSKEAASGSGSVGGGGCGCN
ncbi:DUF4266 domain-containing protein [Undibacterium flavidum]|uniref:DUF4266 domain-containing protein n=1 Tax=Undibacterium flavidum TaxID=2762297 RepID=A0ABR6Y947_9BURK|nr:DUF4266 domain-containing protein [Undibacterium flavidum]MBC3873146.1 DUF4266 domain-containing protein [Undibacterium flavidum]